MLAQKKVYLVIFTKYIWDYTLAFDPLSFLFSIIQMTVLNQALL